MRSKHVDAVRRAGAKRPFEAVGAGRGGDLAGEQKLIMMLDSY